MIYDLYIMFSTLSLIVENVESKSKKFIKNIKLKVDDGSVAQQG